MDWEKIRSHRNKLLSETDWTQLPDNSLSQEQKDQWVGYRQKLRDITEDVNNVQWPRRPDQPESEHE